MASDFDGTISGMVLDPWSAGIIPSAQRALRRLAVTPSVDVALISGRTARDLAARARVGGIRYLGDHGAERAEAVRGFRPEMLRVEREPADSAAVAMADRLKLEVPRLVPEPWLVLEDKGTALTFHFRAAPDTEAARARVRAAVDAIDSGGLLDQPGGVRAWELRPHGATTKGVALRRLIAELRPDVVLMFGDDRHDALAFDALRTAREDGTIRGLAAAVVSRAGSPEVAARADLLLATAKDTARFMTLLAQRQSPTGA